MELGGKGSVGLAVGGGGSAGTMGALCGAKQAIPHDLEQFADCGWVAIVVDRVWLTLKREIIVRSTP